MSKVQLGLRVLVKFVVVCFELLTSFLAAFLQVKSKAVEDVLVIIPFFPVVEEVVKHPRVKLFNLLTGAESSCCSSLGATENQIRFWKPWAAGLTMASMTSCKQKSGLLHVSLGLGV